MDNTLESIRDHVLAEKLLNDNKLISEFMGLESFKDSLASLHNGKINVSVDLHKQAQYHTSWDWLMPVVDKIESMRGVFRRGGMTKGGQQHNATETKYVIEYGMHDKVIAHVYATTRIEAEYQAVVEFIKAKNNQ